MISQNETEAINAENPQGRLPVQKKKRRLVFWIFGFLIIGLICFLVIFFWNLIYLKDQKISAGDYLLRSPQILKLAEKLPIAKITLTPLTVTPSFHDKENNENNLTPYPGDASNAAKWNVYENKELNFSLDYPSDLTVKENSHGLGVFEIIFGNFNGQAVFTALIYPKTIGHLIGQDFGLLYDLPDQSVNLMTSKSSTPMRFTKVKNSVVRSLRMLEFRMTSDPPNPDIEAEAGFYIELKENVIVISGPVSKFNMLKQMVSTFKYSF